MMNRRQLLTRLAALGGGSLVAGAVPSIFQHALAADSAANERILVVFEMSGGNDGLNTIVPYADDTYYKLRPRIAIKKDKLLKLDDHFRSFSDHEFNCVLISQPVRSLHRIVHMPQPMVFPHIAQ